MISPARQDDERQFEASLGPTRLEDFAGQPHVREQLSIAIEAAIRRGEAMDHVLLSGAPGLGKATLARIIAQDLSVPLDQTSGLMLKEKLDLTGILTNIKARQVLFVDEIHRLLPDITELLDSVLEDFSVDFSVGVGPRARIHSMPLPRFTAVGATTHLNLLSASFRGRFGIVLRLGLYDEETLAQIIKRSARLLEIEITHDAAHEIAKRARGTPRVANRLLRRVRDYAQVRAGGQIDDGVARAALDLLNVDRYGLGEVDQKIILTIIQKYRGGPVALATIAASIDEQPEIIEEVYEPYLIQLGFLDRTSKGRVATKHAFEYFHFPHSRAEEKRY